MQVFRQNTYWPSHYSIFGGKIWISDSRWTLKQGAHILQHTSKARVKSSANCNLHPIKYINFTTGSHVTMLMWRRNTVADGTQQQEPCISGSDSHYVTWPARNLWSIPTVVAGGWQFHDGRVTGLRSSAHSMGLVTCTSVHQWRTATMTDDGRTPGYLRRYPACLLPARPGQRPVGGPSLCVPVSWPTLI